MGWGYVIAAALGTGFKIYEATQAAEAEKAAAERKARARDFEADEIERRSKINIAAIRAKGAAFQEGQISRISRAGVALEGSALQVVTSTAGAIESKVIRAEKEARDVAELKRRGASVDRALASDIDRQKNIRNAGSILGGTTKILGASDTKQENDTLTDSSFDFETTESSDTTFGGQQTDTGFTNA